MQKQNTNRIKKVVKEFDSKPTMIILDDIEIRTTKKQLQKIALQYKGKYNMRDNNCKENHERGLQKRIDNYSTQHTLRTMENSPAKVSLNVKRKFYKNVMKQLGLV